MLHYGDILIVWCYMNGLLCYMIVIAYCMLVVKVCS